MGVYYFVRTLGVYVLPFLERDAGAFECDIVPETRSIAAQLRAGLCRRPARLRLAGNSCNSLRRPPQSKPYITRPSFSLIVVLIRYCCTGCGQ